MIEPCTELQAPESHLVQARLGGDWRKELGDFAVKVQRDWYSPVVYIEAWPLPHTEPRP